MSELTLSLTLLGCRLANITRAPAETPPGEAQRYRIVPVAYAFHTPCPFAKTKPDQGCRHCVHHYEQPIARRELSEDEADALFDAAPARWTTLAG